MELPKMMQAMVFEEIGKPLALKEMPLPEPTAYQVLVKVIACGICRTDLHIIDGELNQPKLPLIPGHEILGQVVLIGEQVSGIEPGDIVGIPWLGYTCGKCKYCKSGKENLCENAEFTGYTIDGGYAQYTIAHYQYCFQLPVNYTGPEAAPLLCAGLIGYPSYRMANNHAQNIGLYGFGAAAHIIIQIAIHERKKVLRLHAREIPQASNSHSGSVLPGRAGPIRSFPKNRTPLLFLRPPENSFQKHCMIPIKAVMLSAEESI